MPGVEPAREKGASATLFLFTYTFPFGTGESFLETEIGFLARAWERVVVIPSRQAGDPRPVPRNVTVETGLAGVLERGYAPAEFAAALAARELREHLRRRPGVLVRPGHLRRLVGQIAAARRTAGWMDGYLQRSRPHAANPFCYCYWLSMGAPGLARLKRSRPEVAYVARAHGYDLYAERHTPPYLPLQAEVIASADAVLTISEHGRAYLAERHPQLASRIEVARLGVLDPGQLNLPSPDGRWRILSCSALVPVKRVDLLVRAIGALAERHPERSIEWDHLGDGPLRARVEEEARTRLPRNVSWRIHGQLPNRAVMGYYRSRPVDVLANVSDSEGIPVSIMEAQSFGVPVVATAVGGVGEIVDAASGLLLSSDPSIAEVADALANVCLDSAAARLREGSRRSWAGRYDAEANYGGFVRRLRQVQTTRALGAEIPTERSRPQKAGDHDPAIDTFEVRGDS